VRTRAAPLGIEVVVGPAGQIREVAVHSKYYYRDLHPAWKDLPGYRSFSKAQHDDLIHRVDRLRPLGALLKPAQFGFVVFLRTHFEDEYENGFVNWSTYGPDKQYNYENLIVSFKSSAPTAGIASADVLKSAERVFGPSQQPAILFDFNAFYVARLVFGRDGALQEAAVEPKVFFKSVFDDEAFQEEKLDPLTVGDYRKARAGFETLRPFGHLRRSASQMHRPKDGDDYHQEDFEHALVTWGDATIDTRLSRTVPGEVFWLRVRYN
jgi:hypothetical protein